MKKHNGWKVLIRDGRQSISNWGRKNKFALTYPVNEEVFPKLKNSKLFFFRTRNDAKEFAGGMGYLIVKCIATNPVKQSSISESCDCFIDFWANNEAFDLVRGLAPEGTYVADSITCLE